LLLLFLLLDGAVRTFPSTTQNKERRAVAFPCAAHHRRVAPHPPSSPRTDAPFGRR